MNSEPSRILISLVARYGTSLARDPLRCEGLLRDTCPKSTREIFVLVNAIRQQVPADLLSPRHSLPYPLFRGFLVKRLQDELGFSDEAAGWAVDSWSAALGITVGVPAQEIAPDTKNTLPDARVSAVPETRRNQWAEILAHGTPEAALITVRELAATRDPACIPLLVNALRHQQWRVRSAAYGALVDLGPVAVPVLAGELGDTHGPLAGSVILILGAIRSKEAVPPLLLVLESDSRLAVYAIWALGEIGDNRASTPLMKFLSSQDNYLQQAAAEALKKME